MPSQYREAERALIAHTILGLIQAVRVGRLDNTRDLESLIISAAVLDAQHRHKPLGTAALARVVGIPRATVQRKLDTSVSNGYIARRGTRYIALAPHACRDDYIDKALRIIRRAAAQI